MKIILGKENKNILWWVPGGALQHCRLVWSEQTCSLHAAGLGPVHCLVLLLTQGRNCWLSVTKMMNYIPTCVLIGYFLFSGPSCPCLAVSSSFTAPVCPLMWASLSLWC